VGLFSFLTKNKTDESEAESGPSTSAGAGDAPASSADAAPPAEASQPSSQPRPGSGFVEPDAWDIAALTAPPPPPSGETPRIGPMDPAQTAALQGKVVEALKTVYDPEIPVDIYELGLIYEIIVDVERQVLVRMTLTSPACPSAQQIPSEVRYKVKAIPEVTEAWVEIVWEPPWDKERMSEAAKLALGFF
jgi:FeS assembly SUF system protein